MSDEQPTKPKKSVGFAPLPEDDLKEHHKVIKDREAEELKSNPFHKVPPELAYLEKKKTLGPQPIARPKQKAIAPYNGPILGNLRNKPIKDISFINKTTELNFHYPTISLPISDTHLLIDVKYALLNSNDISKIYKYILNLSGTYICLGYEFSGVIVDVGSKLRDQYQKGDFVVGITDPNDRKGSLATELVISPNRDVVLVVTQEDLDHLNGIDITLDFGSEDYSNYEVGSNVSSVLNHEDDMLNIGVDLRHLESKVKAPKAPETPPKVANLETESPTLESATADLEDTLDQITLDNPYSEIPLDANDSKTSDVAKTEPNDTNTEDTDAKDTDTKDTDAKVTENAIATPAGPSKPKSPKALEVYQMNSLAKLSAFPSLYCRAKEVLSHLSPDLTTANILINGADSNLGFTLIQILNSDLYSFNKLNLILTIREKSYKYMENFVQLFTQGKYYDPSKITKISLITHDIFPSYQEHLILPGEKVLVKYKKHDLFTAQIIEALFKTQYYDDDQLISKSNFAKYRLDLFVDIVGCKKFFQKAVNWKNLDGLRLAIHNHTATSLSDLFTGSVNEPFLVKLLKPKKQGSSLVSCCRFATPEPTYAMDKLLDFYSEALTVNPWAAKWSSNIFNSFTAYNYHEALELRIKKEWVLEGLSMLKQDRLKFRIDEYSDWRINFKKAVSNIRVDDGKIVFKVEDF